jgi:hypothetical protein
MKKLISFLIIVGACQNIFAQQSYTQQFDAAAEAHETYSDSWLRDEVEKYLERRLQDGLRDDVEVIDGDIELIALKDADQYRIEFSFLAQRTYNSGHKSICRATFNVAVVKTQNSFRMIAPRRLDQDFIRCYRQ